MYSQTLTHPISDPLILDTRGVRSQARQQWLILKHLPARDRLVASLRSVNRPDLADPLAVCTTEQTYRRCSNCKSTKGFWNHCDIRHCPICQPRLAFRRASELSWWVKNVRQPKHVILTVRNVPHISKTYVQAFKSSFSKLRRSKFASNWLGGCYSLEVTHSATGFHLHLHAVVDCRWIDNTALSIKWASLVGQDLAIVRVVDVRGTDYSKEVSKYMVKGNELAAMDGLAIAELIDAMDGIKAFGTFGTLRSRCAAFQIWKAERDSKELVCDCGSTHFIYLSQSEYDWHVATDPPPQTPRGVTPSLSQLPFSFGSRPTSHLHASLDPF